MILTPSMEESEISVWDLRAASKRVAVVKQDSKDQAGAGQVPERGMVFSLLLQSQYGDSSSTTKDISNNCLENENEDENENAGNVSAPGSILSTSVPRFMAGYEDGSICCFDVRTFRPVCSIKQHEEPVMTMDISPNGHCVASGGGGNKIARTLLTTNIKVIPDKPKSRTIGTHQPASFSSSSMDTVAEYEMLFYEKAVEMPQFVSLEDKDNVILPSQGTSCVRYRSDGRIIVSGHWDNSFRMYDTKRLKPLAVIRHHRDKVYAVDFAPSFENYVHQSSRPGLFATGSKDSTIAVWSVFEETIR